MSATLLGLLQSSGQAERLGLAQDAFDAIQHQPVFQHFASVLSNDVHFVSPADEELAARHHHYEDPAVEDATLDRLIDMYLTDREAFDGDPLACELRPEIESLLKQGQLERQADEHLARSHMHVSTLQEASSVTRLQQQQAEQGLARLTRAKEHQLAQAGAANAADNASVHAVQECGHAMQVRGRAGQLRKLLLYACRRPSHKPAGRDPASRKPGTMLLVLVGVLDCVCNRTCCGSGRRSGCCWRSRWTTSWQRSDSPRPRSPSGWRGCRGVAKSERHRARGVLSVCKERIARERRGMRHTSCTCYRSYSLGSGVNVTLSGSAADVPPSQPPLHSERCA